jgi:hypothetical protein
MKKATIARMPSKAKAPTQKSKGLVNPILDTLNNMDEDLVAMLRQTMQKEMGFGPEMFGSEDPVDLFAEYLESCALGNVDGDEKTELLTDLVVKLSDLKIDSNGGDREGSKDPPWPSRSRSTILAPMNDRLNPEDRSAHMRHNNAFRLDGKQN